jgi:hypothetical protein
MTSATDILRARLSQFHGDVPPAVLLDWILRETGGNRFAVSRDPVLVEVGWSQAPLARARFLGVDPFDEIGGAWLACIEAALDVARWQHRLDGWAMRPRDALYLAQMSYSVGDGCLAHVAQTAIDRARKGGRTPADRGLAAECIDIANLVDWTAPPWSERRGRQTPEQVKDRFSKHARWISEAVKYGPVDDAPHGPPPSDCLLRPDGTECPPRELRRLWSGILPDFPAALVLMSAVCADRSAPPEQREAGWLAVRRYAKARRKAERAPRAPIVFRAMSLLRRAVGRPV